MKVLFKSLSGTTVIETDCTTETEYIYSILASGIYESYFYNIMEFVGTEEGFNLTQWLSDNATKVSVLSEEDYVTWYSRLYVEPFEPNIYLHLSVTGGDGKEPIGVLNDGTDSINVTCTFRKTSDPVSDILTAITGLSRRVTVRKDTGECYDIFSITFVDGISSFAYKTTLDPAICEIKESDFLPVDSGYEVPYIINLIGDNTFKVYRSL